MSSLFPLLLPIGFLLSIDLYFFQAVKTLLESQPYGFRVTVYIIYWLVNFFALVGLVISANKTLLPSHFRYYVLSVIMVFLISKLIGSCFLLGEDLYRLVTGLLNHSNNEGSPFLPGRRNFISKASVIAAGIPFATMLYGMAKTGFAFRVRRKQVHFRDLPKAFEGLKIVQISDLHSGSFGSAQFFERAVSKIQELSPDLIFFTGDLVNNEAVEAERFVSVFKKLKAPLGVYSILGNHDYGNYGPWPSSEAKAANFERMKLVHKDSGWNLLLNSNQVIELNGEKLAIVGAENWGASRHFPKYGDLNKAVEGVQGIRFKILLSHDPSHWDAKVLGHPQKFQLTLSGHTHGAQFGIEIPGLKWSPAKYIYKQWAGLYEATDGQKIYVNRGLGFIGYMGRIGIPPEISFLELRSTKNA